MLSTNTLILKGVESPFEGKTQDFNLSKLS